MKDWKDREEWEDWKRNLATEILEAVKEAEERRLKKGLEIALEIERFKKLGAYDKRCYGIVKDD